ncbi:MAG: hypothetical protein ABII03_04050, partial [Nanoarchaeota archaeon]
EWHCCYDVGQSLDCGELGGACEPYPIDGCSDGTVHLGEADFSCPGYGSGGGVDPEPWCCIEPPQNCADIGGTCLPEPGCYGSSPLPVGDLSCAVEGGVNDYCCEVVDCEGLGGYCNQAGCLYGQIPEGSASCWVGGETDMFCCAPPGLSETPCTDAGGECAIGCPGGEWYPYGNGECNPPDTYCCINDCSDNFIKSFNRDRSFGFDVLQTEDGGYAILGSGYDYDPYEDFIWLIKTNFKGEKLWDKEYNLYGTGSWPDFDKTSNGYVIVGTNGSYDYDTTRNALLIKTDERGDVLWEKTYGGELNTYARSVEVADDGGYVLGGMQKDASGDYDYWLIKTDSEGELLWEETYGEDNNRGFIGTVRQTDDGGYILAGNIDYDEGIWLIKTDSEGNVVWDNEFYIGEAEDDIRPDVQQTTDGGYVVLGNLRRDSGEFSYDIGNILIKTNENGVMQWNKSYGGDGDNYAVSVQQTTDGGYVVIGGAGDTVGDDGLNAWLFKTDSNGNVVWEREYGWGVDEETVGVSVQQTTDGGYVVAGGMEWAVDGVLLIKTDAQGIVLEECIEICGDRVVTGSEVCDGTVACTASGGGEGYRECSEDCSTQSGCLSCSLINECDELGLMSCEPSFGESVFECRAGYWGTCRFWEVEDKCYLWPGVETCECSGPYDCFCSSPSCIEGFDMSAPFSGEWSQVMFTGVSMEITNYGEELVTVWNLTVEGCGSYGAVPKGMPAGSSRVFDISCPLEYGCFNENISLKYSVLDDLEVFTAIGNIQGLVYW